MSYNMGCGQNGLGDWWGDQFRDLFRAASDRFLGPDDDPFVGPPMDPVVYAPPPPPIPTQPAGVFGGISATTLLAGGVALYLLTKRR